MQLRGKLKGDISISMPRKTGAHRQEGSQPALDGTGISIRNFIPHFVNVQYCGKIISLTTPSPLDLVGEEPANAAS